MKKLIIVGILILVCSLARAESLSIGDTLKSLPGLKQGVAYSMVDNKLNYLTTLQVLGWKDFALEVGYAGEAENTGDKFVAVLSADLVNLKNLGVTVPIIDLIDFRVGLYGGVGRIEVGTADAMKGNNEWDAGISLTAISVKF